MKLRAPEGVGDACVAGVTLVAQDGIYEVDAETAALLVECFGFLAVGEQPRPDGSRAARRRRMGAKKK